MKQILIIVFSCVTLASVAAAVPIVAQRPAIPDDDTPITFNINVGVTAEAPLRDTAKAIIDRELHKQEDIKLVIAKRWLFYA